MNVREKIKNIFLFLFVFLLPTQLGKHFFFSFSFVNGVRIDYLAPAIYAIDLVMFCLMLFYGRAIKQHISKNRRLLILFLIGFAMSIYIAPFPLMALYSIARLCQIYIAFVIFKEEKKKSLLLIISALVAASVFQLVLAMLQFTSRGSLQGVFYFFGERFFTMSSPGIATASLNGREILRPYGTFSHPNSLGGFFVLIYAFSLEALHTMKEKASSAIRMGLIILGAIASLLVFLSFSKAAIGTFLCITIVSGLFEFVQKPVKKATTCIPCMLSRIVIPLVLGFLFFQAKGDVYSLDKRFLLITQSLVLFQQYPIFGVGFGNHLYLQAQFPTPYAEFFLQPVHNIFLLILVQGGLVFTALFSWLTIQQISKRRILIFIAIVLTGLVDHYWLSLIQNMLLIGVVFGLQEK